MYTSEIQIQLYKLLRVAGYYTNLDDINEMSVAEVLSMVLPKLEEKGVGSAKLGGKMTDNYTVIKLFKDDLGDFIVDELVEVSDTDPTQGASTRIICSSLDEAIKAVAKSARGLYE